MDPDLGMHYDAVGRKPHDTWYEVTAYGFNALVTAATDVVMTSDGGNVDDVSHSGLPLIVPFSCFVSHASLTFRGTDPVAFGGTIVGDLSRNGSAVGINVGGGVAGDGSVETFRKTNLGSPTNLVFSAGDSMGIGTALLAPFFVDWEDVEVRMVFSLRRL